MHRGLPLAIVISWLLCLAPPSAGAQQVRLTHSGLSESEAARFQAIAEKALADIKAYFGKKTSLPIAIDVQAPYDIPRALIPQRRIQVPLSLVKKNETAIAHEIAHIVVPSVGKKDRFLDEGLGVYAQELFGGEKDNSFPTFGMELHRATLLEAKRYGSFIPFESAEHERNSDPKHAKARKLAYLVEGSFVKFLIEAHGLEKFMRMYEAGTYEAFYGKTFSQLEQDWRAFLSGLKP